MKERPILFSAPMVTALRAGRKTQTRRLVRLRDGSLPQEDDIARHFDESFHHFMDFSKASPYWQPLPCPQGVPGDRLWVRESWKSFGDSHAINPPVPHVCQVYYTADGCALWHPVPAGAKGVFPASLKGRPSIHMPRWASRLTLEITSIRAEPLQDITESDALAEGVDPGGPVGHIPTALTMGPARYQYATLWDSLHGPDSWKDNPWVWVITFQPMNATTEPRL